MSLIARKPYSEDCDEPASACSAGRKTFYISLGANNKGAHFHMWLAKADGLNKNLKLRNITALVILKVDKTIIA